ncbi:MAG: cytochrome c nitrite reductase small subunit [Desulfobulbaceae bacterium]|nr:cytochrome c nitrite reductase small subunit [Desulfobulbaceae bacterium]
MKKKSTLTYVAVFSVVVALLVFVNLVRESKMLSYLSTDAEACITCHPMNTLYATWQHSSHRSRTVCIDCHLPHDSFVNKMMAKARDGLRHSWAMTFKTYGYNLRVTDNAAGRIQDNCIRCHGEIVSQMMDNSRLYAKVEDSTVSMGRRCWECHRTVPHGRMRNLTATQINFLERDIQ